MRRYLLFWLGLAAFLGACGTEPKDGTEAPSPALWTIAKDGHKAWLFGTVHMLPEDVSWESPAITKAVAQSDLLVLEAAGLENEKRTAAIFEQLGRSPDLPGIAQRVPTERRAALQALMARMGATEQTLAPYESWAAALLLSASAQEDLKLRAGAGVERLLSTRFLEKGKPVIGLETVEGQLGIFDTLPEDAQRALLTQVVEEADSATDQYQAMLAAWLRGDIERIGDTFTAEFGKAPALAHPLLYDRNRNWARQIDALMKRPGTPFIAVGAGHLVGKNSVQAMLVKKGFEVNRVE
ncbi:TraB/GumN family protein [Rhizorhapis sp. SPR117]|uniref:TraB/GumN family protein n=1 Tax=Rhizorhapis sp. SPR117 TaxID=2912611 RepID=UPI001F459C24|nr:TraB/GumN family protein [Rhizorhapis sp. SPR117]